MTTWDEVLEAVTTTLGGDRSGGGERLRAAWDATAVEDHARRCVLAHYLADLEDDLDEEVAWDRRALDEYAHVADGDLAPVGIPSAAGMAASLHLNLGDGLLRQGRLDDARRQLAAGLAATAALPDDGYGEMVRAGLERLRARVAAEATP
ncbi:hypothetical protein JQN72_18050 [Phycicoccus sp. CSK15P-2]|uniref:hypothetical protein n=1 Tax=Phycicoccus sp. CSK15P-2 TaxID=2807627 RepID=UPI00195090F6|nr:hypothetical protein [Phycicoccus sp. CSK15P-2]MBM6406140.1 hypothetical protein [Phycicoccus sp. CSK15P-2]